MATFAWLIGISNAINFLDNMDGLAGGVASIACAFFFLLAVGNNQILVASLSAALFGACLGFLRYNFNQAKIFMGDTGALFLGMVLAAVAIKLRFENQDIVTWMIPVMVLGLPICSIPRWSSFRACAAASTRSRPPARITRRTAWWIAGLSAGVRRCWCSIWSASPSAWRRSSC